MKIFVVLSVLAAAAFADPIKYEAAYYPVRPAIIDSSLRVVNGQNAARGQLPYQVSLQWGTSHICGGSIISANWILTAAHCTVGFSVLELRVRAGILLLTDNNVIGQQTRAISQKVEHHLYPGGNTVAPNDIALLRLASPLQFGSNVQPVKIPRNGHLHGSEAVLSGWGLTQTGGSVPNNLQYVNVPVIRGDECKRTLDQYLGSWFNPADAQRNICSGSRGQSISACNGDSGGPLVQDNYLIGAVSWGLTPCGAANAPSVYVKVAFYDNWITQNTNGEVRPE